MTARSSSEKARPLLQARDRPQGAFLELRHPDRLQPATGGEQSTLVDEIREIGAGEARCPGGEDVQIDPAERLALRVHAEDRPAACAIGAVDHDLAVEAAQAQ